MEVEINRHFDVTLHLHTLQTKIVQNECQTLLNSVIIKKLLIEVRNMKKFIFL